MKSKLCKTETNLSEILILPDGKIFVHNLSSTMAGVLAKLNPADEAMSRRTTRKNNLKHELPN
jgi:hypothetical protein